MTDRIYIGRGPDADVSVPDDYISLRHASVTMRDGRLFIRDEGSTNGTFVNGLRIWGDVEIFPLDTLALGRTRCSVGQLVEAIRDRHD